MTGFVVGLLVGGILVALAMWAWWKRRGLRVSGIEAEEAYLTSRTGSHE